MTMDLALRMGSKKLWNVTMHDAPRSVHLKTKSNMIAGPPQLKTDQKMFSGPEENSVLGEAFQSNDRLTT